MLNFLRRLEIRISLITALVFLIGAADLLRGGITISAIALSVGYCILLPLWIFSWFSRDDSSPNGRLPGGPQPEYAAAAITALVVLLLYLATLSPTTAMWDASEYIAAAYTFGLPHPPGNPFFVVIGRAFSIIPLPISVAARVNILAAVCSAASAAMWFLIAERVLASHLRARWQRIACSACASLIGATAFTVWNQSVVNEKVYTVSLAGIAIVSWILVRWTEQPGSTRADRLLVLAVYLCSLGYANHMAGMLPALAIGVVVLIYSPQSLLRPRFLTACTAALLLGFTPWLTQPIRAGHNPAINEGGISACEERFELSCTMSRETLDRFMYNFNRGQYGKPPVSERMAPFGAQLDMWWLYFKWQWMRDPFSRNHDTQERIAFLFFALGLLGAFAHYRWHKRSFLYFAPLMLTMTVLLIYYLNFKYGASQSPELGASVEREVRDRDYFFLWSFSAWGVWAALGIALIWSQLVSLLNGWKRTTNAHARTTPGAFWLGTSPLLLLAALPLFLNFSAATRHDDTVTAAWARDLLNSVEPYSVLIVAGDNDTFPLWHAQEVEGIRKDVIVATTSLLRTDWHARQIIRRPQVEYDAARGPAAYRNKTWRKPSGSPLGLSVEQADAVPDIYRSDSVIRFEANGVTATIDPRQLEYGILKRDEMIILHIIHGAWPERPLYFARSSGMLPAQLGLSKYLLQQGLVWKLSIPADSASPSRDTLNVPSPGRVDLARSLDHWNNTFESPAALIRRGRWVDEPSATIPTLLVAVGAELAWLEKLQGNDSSSTAIFETTLAMARATSTPGLAEQIAASRPR